jgi:hypothetical protein
MAIRVLATSGLVFALLASSAGHEQQAPAVFNPQHGTLARDETQAIYAPDRTDPWNQVFYLLFTRTLEARLVAAGSERFMAGDPRLALSNGTVTRIESGDRAVEPLYPSWLWMGSTWFDMAPDGPWEILQEPRYSQLETALESLISTAHARPPLARALMQADLWAAYDILRAPSLFRSPPDSVRVVDSAALGRRRENLLPLLAKAIRSLALTRAEIAALPDMYGVAARTYSLPDLFGKQSDWMEVRWLPERVHDRAADYRRAARVFVKPTSQSGDEAAFLDGLRKEASAVDAAALVIQNLLVEDGGSVVPSPLVFEVQIRRFRRDNAGRATGAEISVLELSRKLLLASPETGGLAMYDEESPAYLPVAGNDYGFATPPRLESEPVLVPMRKRCEPCHSRSGRLITFAFHTDPLQPKPRVERLKPSDNAHAEDVARRKMAREDFRALQLEWNKSR